jgi:hypothetical protein
LQATQGRCRAVKWFFERGLWGFCGSGVATIQG